MHWERSILMNASPVAVWTTLATGMFDKGLKGIMAHMEGAAATTSA